ncbi:MAG: GSCFA domain protein [Bacteroidetes bacterium HGW-Bacteroidetes-4]|jgi:ribosomal protein S30|nr:MAG: GSCFA domain protein [Bacteroidetes bacterium HGW-Bacteroidetes-4]
MELFRTLLKPTGGESINYSTRVLTLGSCFSEHMGEYLKSNKFNALINPFGIIYNPLSIGNSIERLLNKKLLAETDLFEHEGVWNSFSHHSRYSGTDKLSVLENINSKLLAGSDFLRQTDVLMLTFGTAWVYEYKKSGEVVSNCHKLPAKEFKRYRLRVQEIVAYYKLIIEKLRSQNSNLKLILTVSPVRHLKDGFHENQLSKAVLLLAVEELCEAFEQVYYFPSYELMMDDLRDYRFYNDDMLHPSPLAVSYIWEKFKQAWINPACEPVMQQIKKIELASKHRPFQVKSESHQKFLQKQLQAINKLKADYPHLDFDKEQAFFENCLLER